MSELTRLVRLSFTPEHVEDFRAFFDAHQSQISTFPGCKSLSLKRDVNQDNVFYTVSFWESAEALERYRASEFFREVWPKVKVWFNEAPLAYSFR